jgi:lysophospholipase L1-like esterase
MAQEPFIVVVWGDSIAAAGWPERSEFVHNVSMNLGRPVKVINMGVGGLPAASARSQFAERVAPHKPDLVVIQFGFNDMRFTGARPDGLPFSTPDEFNAHLQEMIHRCKSQANARVVVFGNHRPRRAGWFPTGLTYEQSVSVYRQQAQNAAQAQNVRFVDMSVETLKAGLTWNEVINEDGIHLSPAGLHNYAGIAASIYMEEIRASRQ